MFAALWWARSVHSSIAVTTRSQVLVVEDDVAVQAALDELFAREGYDVTIANNGAEAIEVLESGARPCCVLVDLLMPGIVGQELLEYIDEQLHASTAVAIITGSPHLAPSGYPMFTKPLGMRELLDFVSAKCPLC
jgi:DNA-binding NtrC family response regulator